jgi:hypothetical protein
MMNIINAEGLNVTFDTLAVSQIKGFTLPEQSAAVDKAAHTASTKMDVLVSNIIDQGQFQLVYFSDPDDAGQTAIRGSIGNTERTIILTLSNGRPITITCKTSKVTGAGSEGLSRGEETATFEVVDLDIGAIPAP